MITFKKAKEIIYQHLRKKEFEAGEDVVLIEEDIIEEDFGWVFFYNSKKGIETGHFMDLLYGNAPLIVDRENGDIHETGTAYPIETYIEKYKQEKGKRHSSHTVSD